MIFNDFFKALAQMADRRFLGVLAKGIGLAVVLLGAMTLGIQWILPDTISIWPFGEIVWLSELLQGFVLFVMIAASTFLMVPVASVFVSLFLDQVTDAVEERHYPSLPEAKRVSVLAALREGVSFLSLLIVVNILALVVYLMSSLLAPIVFWAVNGILLGREYFQMVAIRRLSRQDADKLRRKHRLEIWAAGFLMALPLTIPVVNLVVPVLGIAAFTHLFHRLNARR